MTHEDGEGRWQHRPHTLEQVPDVPTGDTSPARSLFLLLLWWRAERCTSGGRVRVASRATLLLPCDYVL